uniref:G-protein coupled receptors family 1 profile domain-containing protein n=1 Tax=Bos mutus grunniens TaxID=30521 RepID=A0A8B9W8Z0_BOSMU
MEANTTLVMEIVLTGLTDGRQLQEGLQVPLFLVFLVIYLTTMVGNLGLIFLTWKDPHIHTPMYSFLGSLAFADACSSSSVTPKILTNFLSKDHISFIEFQFSSVAQSYLTLCDPMNHSTPGLRSITNSRSSPRLMSIESVMPSSHLILCHPLLLLLPTPPGIRVFSNESTLHMRWPKY